MDAAVSFFTEDINSAVERAFQFRPFAPQTTTLLEDILLNIREKNRIRTSWHLSRDPALKTELNRLQRIIKHAISDAENSRFNDYIAETKINLRKSRKVIMSLRKKIVNTPSRVKWYTSLYRLRKSRSPCQFSSDILPIVPLPSGLEFQHGRISALATNFPALLANYPLTTSDEMASVIRLLKDRKSPPKDLAKYLGVVFDRGWFWCEQIHHARSKALGAYIQLKSFFNNQRVLDQTKLRAFKAIFGS